ncbi:type II toxin-antitoxin system VapC family toxin [Agrobacterium tumefaciens]|uniref:type II toxin-antitoxin system VapC family toxin n=1 Tax=Agrobacterium tumefaciens TaxID=358 RepID=UPI001574130D|nr:type II toxin-antitoxin system VapC family toxin [Agrobacterium tumefaciens]NSZ03294.1 type II toxin-antitoxin system VapC family toxin [Agrobacterium tumefaciens]NSZ38510.1 type II toxin-antitoxin system VapC family toxin [Agrobacterium tumefaciens]NTB24436.1 type II toxin-antitoxin system VapC family toxin [Agrobacterium tumefaciens]NTB28868.1 type II toxin-antitoxin system VapC family toxin [Agrobacterium tumefaciens]NTB35763.1 type II toxin-antitoxin system VapC family toxin [Agrobacter
MKYLLDTNVVSELRKVGDGKADLNVTTWLGAKDSRDLYISAITIFELERGILSIQRRDIEQGSRLRAWMDSRVRPEFAERILSINEAIATRCAHLHIPDRRNEADALIAATAIVHGLVVVTRNIHDFQGTGVVLVDPWRA